MPKACVLLRSYRPLQGRGPHQHTQLLSKPLQIYIYTCLFLTETEPIDIQLVYFSPYVTLITRFAPLFGLTDNGKRDRYLTCNACKAELVRIRAKHGRRMLDILVNRGRISRERRFPFYILRSLDDNRVLESSTPPYQSL